MSKNTFRIITCSRCSLPFECEASENCWCFQVSLSEEARQRLEQRYPDCLCRSCLNELAADTTE